MVRREVTKGQKQKKVMKEHVKKGATAKVKAKAKAKAKAKPGDDDIADSGAEEEDEEEEEEELESEGLAEDVGGGETATAKAKAEACGQKQNQPEPVKAPEDILKVLDTLKPPKPNANKIEAHRMFTIHARGSLSNTEAGKLYKSFTAERKWQWKIVADAYNAKHKSCFALSPIRKQARLS